MSSSSQKILATSALSLASPLLSLTTISMGRPFTPPAALTTSAAIWVATWNPLPYSALLPVMGAATPIRMGFSPDSPAPWEAFSPVCPPLVSVPAAGALASAPEQPAVTEAIMATANSTAILFLMFYFLLVFCYLYYRTCVTGSQRHNSTLLWTFYRILSRYSFGVIPAYSLNSLVK